MKTVPDWVKPYVDHPDYQVLQERLRWKYFYDPILAWILLLFVWPVYLAGAFLIKLDGLLHPESKGSVFYTEPRVSGGKIFYILKFRTVPESVVAGIRLDPENKSITSCWN